MKKLIANSIFKPKGSYDLVRLGNKNDGGYLIDADTVYKSDLLLSFGIFDDWSFEKDFKKINNVKIISFDASVDSRMFFIKIWKAIPRLYDLDQWKYFIKPFEFKRFYSNDNKFVKKNVGYDIEGSISFLKIFDLYNLKDYSNIFLKIDIESSEYRILDQIASKQKQISGLVIEFHDCDLHMDRISNFIKKTDFNICHVHPNNFSSFDNNLHPITLEVSFTKSNNYKQFDSLPHPLDNPNNKYAEDFNIIFD